MKLAKLSLTMLLIAVLSFSISAQERFNGDRECATEAYKSEWLKAYQAGQIQPVSRSIMTQYVPMNIVFVGDNDGTGYINPLLFLNSMELLNNDFRDQNIQFFIEGDIKYLASSIYNNHTFAQGRQMMSENNLNNVANHYIVESPAGACGYYSPSRDGIALGKNCLGFQDRTWSHEMGHFLSLPHTFFGWECVEEISNIPDEVPETLGFPDFSDCNNVEVETVERTNCESAGDGFCDTPADYLMERWSCNNEGVYPDSLTDPNGVRFAVEATNIMSYALDGCVEGFSEDQKGAMITNLDSRLGLVDNNGAITEGANVDNMGLISPENDEDLPVNDFVELTWSSAPGADFYVVQLHSSANMNGAVLRTEITSDTSITIVEGLTPRRRYYWRVRPVNRYVVGGDFTDIIRFRNGEFATSTIDEELNAAITVAPNPVFGGTDLRINGTDLGTSGTMNIELINPAGQVIVTRTQSNVNASGFSERISTANLPAGIYFLRLRLNERLVTRRVVVTP